MIIIGNFKFIFLFNNNKIMFKLYLDLLRDDLLEVVIILLFFMGSKEWILVENE